MLHTHDPRVADSDEFVQPLREANAVWFEGGRQWNIVDSYANPLTYKEVGPHIQKSAVHVDLELHRKTKIESLGPEIRLLEKRRRTGRAYERETAECGDLRRVHDAIDRVARAGNIAPI